MPSSWAGVNLTPVGPYWYTGGMGTKCIVEGCDRPVRGWGYCKTHYQRLRRKSANLTAPIRAIEKSVRPPHTQIRKEVWDALVQWAESRGLSIYAAQKVIYEEWYARLRRTPAGHDRRGLDADADAETETEQ